MNILLLLVHITVCVILILVVLLQTGKRADIAGAFGGGGSQTAFGARGAATFLSKMTAWSAGIFMVTSLVLGVRFGQDSGGSVLDSTRPATPASLPPAAPVSPVPVPPAGAPATPAPTPAPAGSEGGNGPQGSSGQNGGGAQAPGAETPPQSPK